MPPRKSSLRPVCETMEERILHSADLAPLLVSDVGNGLALQQPVQHSANDAVTRGSEIVFVDLSVPDSGGLLADLRAQQQAGRALEVVTIRADDDGLALIGRTLAGRSDIGAVHLLAHGSDGVLQLGNTRLDGSSLVARATELAGWANALTADADLLLYGCDFAQTGVGQQLVRDLALLTGADVAASTDLTGAAALGGNWTLELQTGAIESTAITSASAQQNWQATLALLASDELAGTGSVAGKSGGTGWANAWSGSGVDLASGSLSDPSGNLANSGNSARLDPSLLSPVVTVSRNLGTTLGADGTTTWISFIVQPDKLGGANFAGVEFGSNGFAGYDGNSFVVGNSSGSTSAVTGVSPAAGTNTLLVLRIDHAAGNDTLTLFVNPTPGPVGPDSAFTATYSLDTGSFTRIAITGGNPLLASSNQAKIDEIRVGQSIADVAPSVAPVITSNGGGASASVTIAENTTAVTTVVAVDFDGPATAYSIVGGADAAKFSIGAGTGILQFVAAPDFENPTDAGANNVYDVVVRASDGSRFDQQAIAITVTDVGGPMTVSTTSDVIDGDVSSVEKLLANEGSDGFISLREAISAANNSAGMDTIVVPAGTYTLTIPGAGENLNATGDLDVRDQLTITGAGAGSTVISGGGTMAVFHFISGSSIVSGVTIRDGATSASGAGIEVNFGASLTLSQSIVRNNSTSGGDGGGILSSGALTLTDVEVRDNSAYNHGGGISHSGTLLSLERVTLAGNSAWRGGGLYGAGAAQSLTNVTVSSNTAGHRGGGIYLSSNATLQNVTIANNSAGSPGGGGIYIESATLSVTLRNVLLANNTNGNLNKDNNDSGVTSLGNNLSTANNTELTQSSDRNSIPMVIGTHIGALTDNGGFTRTHALLGSSWAINAGTSNGAPATDQRGTARIGAPDIGAFEFAGSANTAPFLASLGNLTTINEDPASDAGTLVSALIAGRFSDPDAGAWSGIAVTSVTNTNGTWQYTVDGGSNWLAFGAPSVGAARLLAADALTRVRFVPAANWSGTVVNGLGARAWDQTSGSAGGPPVDTTSSGGSGAFGFDVRFASITVNAVNDAPSGTDKTLVMDKNGSRTLVRADFGFADNAAESNAFASVLVQVPTAGTLRLNGVVISAPTDVTVAQLDANLLVFTPAAGIGGAPYAIIGFQVRDSGGTANGGVDRDPTVRNLRIDVTNQVPVITSNGGSATASISRPENNTTVTTVTATDGDGDALVFSISGGADMARFSINAGGVLSFVSAPSFEAMADANADNVYEVTVMVTDPSGASRTQALSVTVTDVYGAAGSASGQLWLTTANNQGTASGGTTWNAGQMLQYGNQGDRFDVDGSLTRGTVDLLAGFAETLPVRAMHYVQSALTIGTAGNTQFALNPGDLLLVLDTGAGTVVRDGVTIDRKDIVVFRPTVAGNYGAGAYYMLLNDGVHDAVSTYEVHGLTLVESAITVGGQSLQAGTFIVAHSTPAIHNNIYWFTASSTAGATNTGPTTTTNTQLLLDGSAFNLTSGGDKVSGLHLLTAPTVFNDTLLAAGTLLLSIDGGTHSIGPVGQQVSQDANDVVAVTFSNTLTVTSAQVLFDGSDLQLTGPMTSAMNGFTVVTLVATNSVPIVAAPLGNQSTNEDVAFFFTVPVGTFTDADAGDTLTYSATLTSYAALPAWLGFNPGSRVFSGVPANGDVGSFVIRVTATDSVGASTFSDFTLTVNNVNDAPVLLGANDFAAVAEDAFGNNGTLVSSLILGQISDVDAGAMQGIAITAVDSSDGTWEFSLDRSSWTAIDAVSGGSALLLAADATTAVRFVPNADWNGSVVNGLTFRAWDRSVGAAGTKVNTSPNGGTSAFSSATGSSSITVSAVNDAPTITMPSRFTVVEDVASPLNGIVLGDADANGGPVSVVLTVDSGLLSGSSAAGVTVTGSATLSLTLTGTITNINSFIAARNVTFTTAANATDDVSLDVSIDDGGNSGADPGASGTPTSEAASASALLTVTAVNDAPALDIGKTPVLTTQNEDSGAPVGPIGTLVSELLDPASVVGGLDNATDADDNAVYGVAVIGADTSNGTWHFSIDDGATWSALGPVSGTSARLLASDEVTRIYFQPNANFNGSIANAISFRAWDQSTGFSGQGLVNASVTGGASPFSSATETAGITVSAINDAPVITALATISVNEDVAKAITGIIFSDVDAGTTSVTASFSVATGVLTAAPAAGVVLAGSGSGALTLTGSIADINALIAAGKLNFTPAPNATADVVLDVSIDDGGNTGTDPNLTGTGTSEAASKTLTLVVTAVNDAPTISAPATITITEDVAGVISGITFADVDAASGTVTATFSVGSGGLSATSTAQVSVGGNATALTLSGTIADVNTFLAANGLRFTTAANATANVTLTVRIDDGGNTGIDPGLSGTATSESASTTLTLLVTAVNDAPSVAVPLTIGVVQDTASALTGITFADVDAGAASVVATFSVASGNLAAASGSGVSVGGVANALTLTGSIANINAFIAAGNLRFTTAAGAAAAVNLAITINDGGNSGSGVPLSAATTSTLAVAQVNQAPTVQAPASLTVTEDVASAITGITFGDLDAGGAAVTATFSVGSGTLAAASGGGVAISGSSSTVLVMTGSIADINTFVAAGRLLFTTAADATADVTLRSAIDDGGNTGIGGARTAFAQSTIVVTPVNDAPLLQGAIPGRTTFTESPVLFQLPEATFTDPDGDALQYIASMSNGSALPAWLKFDASTRTFSGTPTASHAGTVTVRVVASDNAGASAQAQFTITVESVPVEPELPTSTPAPKPEAPKPADSNTATPSVKDVVEAQTAAATPAPPPEDVATVVPAPPAAPDAPVFTIDVATASVAPRQFDLAELPVTAPVAQSETVLAGALLTQFGDIATSSTSQMLTNDDMLRKLEELKRQMLQQEVAQQTVIASTIALTSGLSIGYVVWLIRGGILVSSMLSALPAWQLIDPLPVLATTPGGGNRKGAKPGTVPAEDPEVEKLFDDKAKAPPAPAATKPATAAPTTAGHHAGQETPLP